MGALRWSRAPLRLAHDEGGLVVQRIYRIVRQLLFLKSISNGIYAFSLGVLLSIFRVGLAWVVALIGWFLHFVPEVGAIVCVTVLVPLVLLDVRRSWENRWQTIAFTVVGSSR